MKNCYGCIHCYLDMDNNRRCDLKKYPESNNINCIYDKELSELLHVVICRYVNDQNISYIERENVSKKIFPYVELLEKQGEKKPQGKSALEAVKEERSGGRTRTNRGRT